MREHHAGAGPGRRDGAAMRIRGWFILVVWFVSTASVAQAPTATSQAARIAGVWRTENGGLQLRIDRDGGVEAFIADDGKLIRGRVVASSRRGASVLLDSGEVLTLGPGSTPDTLQGAIDVRLFALVPLPQEHFGRMVAAPRGESATGGTTAGSLAGLKLHRVSSGNNSGSETIYWFCRNGQYRYFWQSLSGGSSLGASEEAGVWRQSGTQLQLQSRVGSKTLVVHPVSELKVELDGRAYALSSSGC